MPPRYRGPKKAGPPTPSASNPKIEDGRLRCVSCGAPHAANATICSMCHMRIAAPAPKAAAPRPAPARPRTAPSPGAAPVRPPPQSRGSFGSGLLQAAASVAQVAVDAVLYGAPGTDGYYEYNQYRESQWAAESREQAFSAALIAQAESGTLAKPGGPTVLADAPDAGYWQCPRFNTALEPLTVASMHMHVNRASGGLMLERDSERFLREHPETWDEVHAEMAKLAAAATRAVDGRALVYLSCPTCGGPMVRKNFEKVSGVMVDCCPKHGTWFDAGELSDALRFLQGGGQGRRAEFEAKEAAHIREQKQKIRDIEARTPTMGRYPGHTGLGSWPLY